jgi:hypothetical protein
VDESEAVSYSIFETSIRDFLQEIDAEGFSQAEQCIHLGSCWLLSIVGPGWRNRNGFAKIEDIGSAIFN